MRLEFFLMMQGVQRPDNMHKPACVALCPTCRKQASCNPCFAGCAGRPGRPHPPKSGAKQRDGWDGVGTMAEFNTLAFF